MTSAIDEFDRKLEERRERNGRLLDMFRKDLEKSGLKEKTISRHLGNVEFFLNSFLAWHVGEDAEEGPDYISSYLGDYFISKCMWSTPAEIQANSAGIKKFYASMQKHGIVEAEKVDLLKATIKEEMPFWKEACSLYNDDGDYDSFLW